MVYVYWAKVDDAAMRNLPTRFAILDDRERCAGLKPTDARVRAEYITAHALARTVLSEFCPREPRSWQFRADALGKPNAIDAGIRFNLSHTNGMVACAVALSHELGVDVEFVNHSANNDAIARENFTREEYAEMDSLPFPQRNVRFCELWTLKEAYLKATGLGLRIQLDLFSVRCNGARLTLDADPMIELDPGRWQFAQTQPSPEHVLSVAVDRGEDSPLAIEFRAAVELGF